MCWNAEILSTLHSIVGNSSASREYGNEHSSMKYAMSKAFWNEQDGTWYDLDLESENVSNRYYVSNPTPLFQNCVHNLKDVHEKTADYLKVNRRKFSVNQILYK